MFYTQNHVMSSYINFVTSRSRSTKLVISSVVLILALTFSASLIQSDFGNVDVEIVKIVDEQGISITGKLYKPVDATNSSKAPAVLLLHGLNNDKDTEAPTSIELSRRGFVVLALDEHGHGDSDQGGSLLGGGEPSLGGNAAYLYLQGLAFVQADKIGLVGHSMGGGSAISIASNNSDYGAIALQAFGPQNFTQLSVNQSLELKNYLQVWPRYEESSFLSREDWVAEGTAMIEQNLEFRGETLVGDGYDVTYGSFEDGTAHRYALIDSTHPGGTWNKESVKEVVAWMELSLNGRTDTTTVYEEASDHIYYLKEVLTLVALLISLFSLIPLVKRLLQIPYFEKIKKELPTENFVQGRSWVYIASLNAFIGGFTFLFLPQVGVLLFGAIGLFIPIFSLLVANAFLFWFLINAIIAHLLFNRWKKRNEIEDEDVGRVSKDNPDRAYILRRSFLLAVVSIGYLYIMSAFVQSVFLVELRFMWSFFRILTPYRMFMFVIYFFPVLYFFMINGGVFLYGQARALPGNPKSVQGQLVFWLKNVFNMLSVIILLFILQYIPMYLSGAAPSLGGILQLWWLMGIFLMSIIPEFLILFFLTNVFYLKTGRYYVGSFIASFIVTLVIVTGALG